MIIFLFGEDTYRMREKLKEMIEEYKKIRTSRLDLRYFEGDDDFFGDFEDSLKQASMFKERKMAVLFNPLDNNDFKEKFLEQLKDFSRSEDIIIIYQERKVDKKTLLFKKLTKNAKTQEFELLNYEKLKLWTKKKIETQQARIDSQALDKLIEYVGNDLWRMSNEIQKLVNYKKSIGIKEVGILVKANIETDIFETIDAISQKNKKQALKLLHKHLEKGDSPLYLLTMINYQFRNLLIVKNFVEKKKPYNLILKKSGLHPFVVKKSYYQCQKFSFPELKKIYQKIFQADLDIKTGKIEPTTALDLLLAGI